MFTKTYKDLWISTFISAFLFIIMLPCSVGRGQLPIHEWTCFFAWMFLIPLWTSLRHRSQKEFIFFGFMFCLLSSLGTLYWIFTAIQKYGGISTPISLMIMIAFMIAESFLRSLSFIFASFFTRYRAFPLLAAVIFGSVEWMMFCWPFHGFPWISPAHGIYPMNHLVQSLDLIGVIGMNFVIYFINFLTAEWILTKRKDRKYSRYTPTLIGFIFGAMWTYGNFQLQRYQEKPTDLSLQIALLQGNISQDIKWSYDEREQIVETYQHLTGLAAEAKPDLIVWPEASLPKMLRLDVTEIDVLPEGLGSSSVLIGAPTYSSEKGKSTYRNSAFTLTGQGAVLHRYDKVRLVPFGEYVPSFGILPIEKLVPAVAGNFTSGGLEQEISKVGEHPFGIFICFETLFPDIARAWVDRGAEFFVSITNDAWFDKGSGPYQHLEFSGLRAIEFRKPVVRAANTGITSWFDATGKRGEAMDLGGRGYLMAKIYPNQVHTIYAKHPFALPTILWLVFGCIILRRKFFSHSTST